MSFLIEGDITLLTLRQMLASAPSASTPVILDFAEVGKIDSSAISYVLHILRGTKKSGQTLQLLNAPSNFIELAKLYGVEGLLHPFLSQSKL